MILSLYEMIWVKSLLFELYLFREELLQLYCDSKSITNITDNSVHMIASNIWRLIGSSSRRAIEFMNFKFDKIWQKSWILKSEIFYNKIRMIDIYRPS
jgi:hypothetical protein